MSERTIIEMLYGEGAHANTVACVEDIPFEFAGCGGDSFPHSIWQLVYHMNFWMEYELKRVRGESPAYPEHASESWPAAAAPNGDEEWVKAIAHFQRLLAELANLADSPPDVLAHEVAATHPDHAKRSSSLLTVLWQTAVHNSYHIGQIVMLRRSLGAWPPKRGGDTW